MADRGAGGGRLTHPLLSLLLTFFVGLSLLLGAALLEGGPFPVGRLQAALAACAALAVLCLAALLWRSRPRLRRAVLYLCLCLIGAEVVLQLLSAAALLPPVNLQLNTPYGRVYWHGEGSNHTVMNRYGWHSARVAYSPGAHKIALVGDSFLEGLQVAPEHNVGAVLERLLSRGTAPGSVAQEVISFGRSATGPAHYLQIIKYALAHDAPDDIFLFLFLGNDLYDNYYMAPDPGFPSYHRMLLYHLTPAKEVALHPRSPLDPDSYLRRLNYNHRLTALTTARTLISHSMMVGLVGAAYHLTLPQPAAHPPPAKIVFPVPLMASGDRLRVVQVMLERIHRTVQAAGKKLRLVVIPHLPPHLLEHAFKSRTTLTASGMLAGEQYLSAMAGRMGLPLLPLGKTMERLSKERIQALFIGGFGHFTEEGHAFVARAIQDKYYPHQRPEPGSK